MQPSTHPHCLWMMSSYFLTHLKQWGKRQNCRKRTEKITSKSTMTWQKQTELQKQAPKSGINLFGLDCRLKSHKNYIKTEWAASNLLSFFNWLVSTKMCALFPLKINLIHSALPSSEAGNSIVVWMWMFCFQREFSQRLELINQAITQLNKRSAWYSALNITVQMPANFS